jgi:hypothetical protein
MSREAAVRRAFERAIEQSLPDQELRYLKAWQLVSGGCVRIQPGYTRDSVEAQVASQSERGVIYKVQHDPRRGWACDCMDFQARGGRRGFQCKHIRAVSWVWGSVRDCVAD